MSSSDKAMFKEFRRLKTDPFLSISLSLSLSSIFVGVEPLSDA
jgi:hypothetical protein